MFTVNQLAKLAGITNRTLHHYDTIGLLEPTQIGENGYRYYDDKAMLKLQQILLYKELGMPLMQIKQILSEPGFNMIAALMDHKNHLGKAIERLNHMLTTVDDTILHIQGEKRMSPERLFERFNEEQQARYEEEAMQKYDPETVKASNARWRSYSMDKKDQILAEGNQIYLDIVKAMPLGADSAEVQACIVRWHQNMQYFWSPDDEQLISLAEGYLADPRFKANFDKIHLDLAAFMGDAVRVYVEKRKNESDY